MGDPPTPPATHLADADADADLAALVERLNPRDYVQPGPRTQRMLIAQAGGSKLWKLGMDAFDVLVSSQDADAGQFELLARTLQDAQGSVRALRFGVSPMRFVPGDTTTKLAPFLDACAGVLEVLDVKHCIVEAKVLAPHLSNCTKLRHLVLRGSRLGVEGVAEIMQSLESGFPNLVHLDLSGTQMGTGDGVEELVIKHEGLRRLLLSQNELTPRSAAALAAGLACQNLEHLSLSSNTIGAEGVAALAGALAKCTKLCELDLAFNNLGAAGARGLASALASCPNIRGLSLQSNALGSEGAAALSPTLGQCTKLERMDLGSNNLLAEGAQALSLELAKCTHLRELDLGHNDIGSEGAAAHLVPLLEQLTKLERLNLVSNKLDAHALQALAPSLGKCTSLQRLDLSFNPIREVGAAALASALESWANLESLNLCSCELGADGVTTLAAALSRCTRLSELTFQHNVIGSEGAAALATSLADKTALKELNFSYCDLNDEGVRRLASLVVALPGLRLWGIYGNIMTDVGARALAEQLARRVTPIELYINGNSFGRQGVTALASVLPLLHPDSKVSLSGLGLELCAFWMCAEEDAPQRRAVLALMGAWCASGDGAACVACKFVRSDGDTSIMRRVLSMLVGEGGVTVRGSVVIVAS